MDVKDVNDEAPHPLNETLSLTNQLNSTYNIEFIDDDEGATSITVTMTKGSQYFELADAPAASSHIHRLRSAFWRQFLCNKYNRKEYEKF